CAQCTLACMAAAQSGRPPELTRRCHACIAAARSSDCDVACERSVAQRNLSISSALYVRPVALEFIVAQLAVVIHVGRVEVTAAQPREFAARHVASAVRVELLKRGARRLRSR